MALNATTTEPEPDSTNSSAKFLQQMGRRSLPLRKVAAASRKITLYYAASHTIRKNGKTRQEFGTHVIGLQTGAPHKMVLHDQHACTGGH
jgi:hypothetical protein